MHSSLYSFRVDELTTKGNRTYAGRKISNRHVFRFEIDNVSCNKDSGKAIELIGGIDDIVRDKIDDIEAPQYYYYLSIKYIEGKLEVSKSLNCLVHLFGQY